MNNDQINSDSETYDEKLVMSINQEDNGLNYPNDQLNDDLPGVRMIVGQEDKSLNCVNNEQLNGSSKTCDKKADFLTETRPQDEDRSMITPDNHLQIYDEIKVVTDTKSLDVNENVIQDGDKEGINSETINLQEQQHTDVAKHDINEDCKNYISFVPNDSSTFTGAADSDHTPSESHIITETPIYSFRSEHEQAQAHECRDTGFSQYEDKCSQRELHQSKPNTQQQEKVNDDPTFSNVIETPSLISREDKKVKGDDVQLSEFTDEECTGNKFATIPEASNTTPASTSTELLERPSNFVTFEDAKACSKVRRIVDDTEKRDPSIERAESLANITDAQLGNLLTKVNKMTSRLSLDNLDTISTRSATPGAIETMAETYNEQQQFTGDSIYKPQSELSSSDKRNSSSYNHTNVNDWKELQKTKKTDIKYLCPDDDQLDASDYRCPDESTDNCCVEETDMDEMAQLGTRNNLAYDSQDLLKYEREQGSFEQDDRHNSVRDETVTKSMFELRPSHISDRKGSISTPNLSRLDYLDEAEEHSKETAHETWSKVAEKGIMNNTIQECREPQDDELDNLLGLLNKARHANLGDRQKTDVIINDSEMAIVEATPFVTMDDTHAALLELENNMTIPDSVKATLKALLLGEKLAAKNAIRLCDPLKEKPSADCLYGINRRLSDELAVKDAKLKEMEKAGDYLVKRFNDSIVLDDYATAVEDENQKLRDELESLKVQNAELKQENESLKKIAISQTSTEYQRYNVDELTALDLIARLKNIWCALMSLYIPPEKIPDVAPIADIAFILDQIDISISIVESHMEAAKS